MKIRKIGVLLVFTMLLFVTGCSDKDNTENTEDGKVSLEEIRKEAETFSYKGTGIDVSNADIIIPDSQTIYDLTFDLRVDSPEQIEEKFFEDLELFMNVSEVNRENVIYIFRDENAVDTHIPIDEAKDEEKYNANSCLIYCDGTYSKVLFNTSYMCEMGCNTIPTELTQDTTDYSDYIWGYRGLDLGVYTKTYYIPDDDISGVSYKLYNGEVKLQDAIAYVEEHIQDYNFAGSPYLDYKVYKVDVRRLDDTTYYYQFKVKACYDGISFNKDAALGTTEGRYPVAEDHIVSMYEGDSIGYIWASCHSYDYLELGKEYTEFITLEEACRLLDEKLAKKTAFEISSIELLYVTEFTFAPDDELLARVETVECYPVYHFVVKHPGLSGYSAIYFDVKVDTGEVLVSQY